MDDPFSVKSPVKTFPPRYSSSAPSLHTVRLLGASTSVAASWRCRGKCVEPVDGCAVRVLRGRLTGAVKCRLPGPRGGTIGAGHGEAVGSPRGAPRAASVTVIAPKIPTRGRRISDLLALRTTLGAEARQGRVDPSGFRRIKCFRSSARFLKHPICLLQVILAGQGHFMISRAVLKPCCRSVT